MPVWDFYFLVLSSICETVAQAVYKSRGLRGCVCVCECTIHRHSLAEEHRFEVHCQNVQLGQQSAVCG